MSARHILHRDIETRSTIDLTDVGVWCYAGDPSTDVWCVAYAIDDEPARIWTPDKPIPEEFLEAARNSDWIVVAHNDAFERAIEELILAPRYGWPLTPIAEHRCTMALALASALPAALDTVAEVLDLPIRKDAAGARLMRLMSRPRKPRAGENPAGIYWHDDSEKIERLCGYCRQDTEVERLLFHRLTPLTDSEQALWVLDAVINQRGFHTDGRLLEAASRIADTASLLRPTRCQLPRSFVVGNDFTSATKASQGSVRLVSCSTCPLYLRKRTLELSRGMSALCQKRTLCSAANV